MIRITRHFAPCSPHRVDGSRAFTKGVASNRSAQRIEGQPVAYDATLTVTLLLITASRSPLHSRFENLIIIEPKA